MLRTRKTIKSLLAGCLVAAPLFAAFAVDPPAKTLPTSHHRKTQKKQAAPLVLPPLPAGPLRQVPMDQIPASAPRVTYENGLLAIAAQNSTLGEILRDVRQLTGAAIELPPNGATERVVTQVGPGQPRDVLAQLLNGTPYNYVMVGSTSDPRAVASVVLTSKPTGGEVQTAENFQPPVQQVPAGMPPMPFRPGIVQQVPPQPATAEADENSDEADAEDKDDESDGDQAQQGQPGQVMPQPEGGPQNSLQGPNGGPMSPETQILLQKLRQGQQPGAQFPPQQPPEQQQQ
jgi:hypothetical protein